MPLFGGYKASKLKPQLKMAITRFQISANKKSALSKQQIREIAQLLALQPHPKEEKARIKAEALIREDNAIEAYEILQLTCELLAERINLITHSKQCPADLIGSVSTLLWASSVVDIPELIEVRRQFRYKYGAQFEEDALMNVGGVVNERVAAKLSVQPPSAYLVQTYLEKIAEEFGVDWKPKVALSAEEIAEPMVAPVGYSVMVGGGSGLNPVVYGQEYGGVGGVGGGNGGDGESSKMSASAPPISPSFAIPPEAPLGKNPSASTRQPQQQQQQQQQQHASQTQPYQQPQQPQQQHQQQQQQSSTASSVYVPVLPSLAPTQPSNQPSLNPSNAQPPVLIDDIEEEVDIYIPAVPKSSPGVEIGGGGGQSPNDQFSGDNVEDRRNDSDEDENDGGQIQNDFKDLSLNPDEGNNGGTVTNADNGMSNGNGGTEVNGGGGIEESFDDLAARFAMLQSKG